MIRLRRLSIVALVLGQACATMVHGTTQDIPIYTPVPAAVAVDGVEIGRSPMTVIVSRWVEVRTW
jgi:hypothetical protein